MSIAGINYLTVQDILWINLQVTKKVQHFNFARLEEATFYQYAYGESNSLIRQAARFLPGFMRMKPFEAGNASTALVSCLAFVELNHSVVTATDDSVTSWFDEIISKQVKAHDAICSVTKDSDSHGHEMTVREAIQGVLKKFPRSIEALACRPE